MIKVVNYVFLRYLAVKLAYMCYKNAVIHLKQPNLYVKSIEFNWEERDI